MKKKIRYCPWIIWFLEAVILLLGGYKLIALQASNSQQVEDAWITTKEIYQLALDKKMSDSLSNELSHSIHQKIAANLGTKITYCSAPPKYGYSGGTWSVEGLDPVNNIQASYGPITIPCEKEWVEVKAGKIGKLNKIQSDIDSLETWFWWLGFLLIALKFLELYLQSSHSEATGDRNKKKKRSRLKSQTPRKAK